MGITDASGSRAGLEEAEQREKRESRVRGGERKSMPNLLDRVNAGMARMSAKNTGEREVDIAFVKATNHDPGPPKEKHMRKLLNASDIHDSQSQKYVVGLIEHSLLSSRDCVVVAKTLVILHKLLREGGGAFREAFYKGFTHLFEDLRNFKDDMSRANWQLSSFIRGYSTFLSQRCVFFSSFPYEQEPGRSERLDAQALTQEVPLMQKCTDLGLQVGTSNDVVARMSLTALQGYAQHLVLGDVLVLSLHMMRAIPRLVEVFFQQPIGLDQAKDMVIIYKEARNLIERMSNLDESLLGQWGGLQLSAPPAAVLSSMQEKVEELSSSRRESTGEVNEPQSFTDISSTPSPEQRSLSELTGLT